MKYKVLLIESEEGFAVNCPRLRGCHCQGRTRKEALENSRIAISEWLDSESDEKARFHVIEEEVTV